MEQLDQVRTTWRQRASGYRAAADMAANATARESLARRASFYEELLAKLDGQGGQHIQ